jgi:hypothetical protein
MTTTAPLCQQYLADRGISVDTANLYGLELDDRLCSQTVKDRLGRKLPEAVNEVIWFPIFDFTGTILYWLARPLPNIANLPKFLCPLGSSGAPFIARSVYRLAHGKPIIITEGPIKALACLQAGIDALGLNGIWGASTKNSHDEVVIRAELQNALDWRGRRTYLCFDADYAINPDVKHGLFRLFFILSAS